MAVFERIPAYDLGRIRKWRSKISRKILTGNHYYSMLDPPEFNRLIRGLRKLLHLNGQHESALQQTLGEFMGREVTAKVADRIALKLAGGLKLLREGESVLGTIAEPTWFPIEISEVRYGKVRDGWLKANMSMTIMAGSAAGTELHREISYKQLIWVVANDLGWNKTDLRPLHNELVGMWFTGLVQPGSKLAIDSYRCAAHQKKYNKKIRNMRRQPCVRRLNQRCHTCPIGYSECHPRGTHRYTWAIKACKSCKREQAAFDPERPDINVCISCQTKSARLHWARERIE